MKYIHFYQQADQAHILGNTVQCWCEPEIDNLLMPTTGAEYKLVYHGKTKQTVYGPRPVV